MKATIRATGEIIDVEWSNARTRWIQMIPSRKNKPLQNDEIDIMHNEPTDESNIIDWEQRRYEIAREFFLTGSGNAITAIANADLFVKILKETPVL